MNFLIIGNPESQRVKLFQRAVKEYTHLEITVLAHLDLITGKKSIKASLNPGCIIKIESPGKNFYVERELIKLGAKISESPITKLVQKSTFDKGRILYPALWYKGWKQYLKQLRKTVDTVNSEFPNGNKAVFMNQPEDIWSMYDKKETHKRLSMNNIATAPALDNISSYDHLHEIMKDRKIFRVFIKLRYGSSASGLAAYEFSPRLKRGVLITTVEMVRGNGQPIFYNTRKIRKHSDTSTIRSIVDFLCREGVHVERWIPKRFHQGKSFDVRVITIKNKACHRIARLSHSPFTNLHLRNQRKVIDASWCDPQNISTMEKVAEKASKIYPNSLYSGIDVLLPINGKKPVILEANAFGDFLNGVYYNNMTPYQYQVRLLSDSINIRNRSC